MTTRGELTPPAGLGGRERPLSVGDAIRAARNTVYELGPVWVDGETSSVKAHPSGHVYFALKDARPSSVACLNVVLFRADAQRLPFRLENGQRVRCAGRFDVYERGGQFQLNARLVEPVGLGAEALALEQLKQKLAAEGLFAAARKRPLPLLPRRIGVVTSRSGAALRDIIRAVQRRFPVPILVADAQVQGAAATRQIVGALRAIATMGVDVIIVGRGGGAAADLAAFDDEAVVRAIAGCPVPVISAVGHEVDVSLSDLVADVRAATPTMAGELAVPVLSELADKLDKAQRRLDRELALVLRGGRQEVDTLGEAARRHWQGTTRVRRVGLVALERRLEARHPQAQLAARRAAWRGLTSRLDASARRRLDRSHRELVGLEARLHAVSPRLGLARRRGELGRLEARLAAATRRRVDGAGGELAGLVGRFQAMSPLAVLARGYALATRAGEVVRDAAALAPGDSLTVRLALGAVDCRVEATHDVDVGAAGRDGDPRAAGAPGEGAGASR